MKKVKILSIEKLQGKRHVYDLSVEGNHNFFVGELKTLTHNCDYFTPDAQAALRNLMEVFSLHTRFILTCNYHERISDPIISRCQSFAISPPSKKDVAVTLANILARENVKYDKETIVALINTHYPDIRAIINTAQCGTSGGVLQLDKSQIIEGEAKMKAVEMLKNPNHVEAFNNIRQLLADNSIKKFADFYSVLYEKIDDYSLGKPGEVLLALAEGQLQDAQVIDKEICFMATIVKILRAIK